jgi:hypothetical protein
VHGGKGVIPFQSHIIVGAIALAVGFASGWQVNGWRLGNAIEKQKAEAAQALAMETAKARKIEKDNDRIRIEAEVKHAKARDQIERTLADNRRLARQLGGLRDPGRKGSDCPLPGSAEATSNGDAGTSEGRLSGESAGLLSPEASDFILELAADADRAAQYARTCHEWAVNLNKSRE